MNADGKNTSLVFCIHLLRMLYEMRLIEEEEYSRIVSISEEYYGTNIYCA